MKIAVIGSGAIGTYYGARLLSAGHEVHFLFHSDYGHVRDNGLRVDSVRGDMFFPQVNAYGRVEDMPRCDVVLVATKTTTNHLLEKLLPPVCGPGSVVVLMQNGLNGERAIDRLGLGVTVIGCLCFVCCNKVGPGHVAHLDYGKVTLGHYLCGDRPAGVTPELERAATLFEGAGIPVEKCDDLILTRWRKLFWNIAFNGPCALLGATTDLIVSCPATRRLARDLMVEVRAGALSMGRDIPESFIGDILDSTDRMAPYKPSMMLDAENRRPLEAEAIYGEPLRTAAERGVDLPAVRTIYLQLLFLDERLRSA
ncbi:putative 2-dehydropantoate 2-reductase [Desulfomicrobium salsuginis]